MLQLMAMQPLQAAVLGSSGEAVGAQGSAPNAAQQNSGVPDFTKMTPQQQQQMATQIQSMSPQQQQQLMSQAKNLSPQQQQELMNQAKQMNPEQLQAIAKSLSPMTQQSQTNLQATATAGQVGHKQGQSKALAPDAGLIEEVVPVKPATPAPAPELSVEDMKRQQAFNSLMQEVLPLSPDQIKDLHRFYDMTLQAKATAPNAPPTPNFTSIVVNLEPGSQPPVIRLSAGFVTSVLFVDSTGAAWPITAYSIGDPQSFNIQWDQKSNAMFIQSMKQYSHGNLAVRLWGLDTPVMVTLVSGQRNVDFRVDLQVGGRGPDAKPPVVDTTYNAKVNPLLINILDGIPPRDSIKLSVTGGHGEAWLADSRVYFRTKLTVLSPAWTATVSSPDGTHVYEMILTPFILASENGKTIDIKLSGL